MEKKKFGQTTVGRIIKGLVGTAVPAIAPLLQGRETSVEDIIAVLKGDPELSADEKLSLEAQILDAAAKEERAVSTRWKADAMSDSVLSKNIRPAAYLGFTLCIFFLMIADFYSVELSVSDTWINFIMITYTSMTCAYFGGRTFEKFNKMKHN